MKFFIVLSALAAVALAKPSLPLGYVHVLPGAPTGPDGRVVDTPEVAYAKAEHAAAHINEKVTLANEAVKSADVVAVAAPGVVSAYSAPALVSAYPAHVGFYRYAHGAPVGVDGRVVDTPEVAHAKVEHAAAHINEKVTLANEAAKNYAAHAAHAVVSAYSAPLVSAYSAPAVVSAYPHGLVRSVVPAISVW
ncbi:cuticle protein 12.5-like [Neodiprion virginianus]|uniref:cuticle protein 12.5-like n=1 Tax=Neodiprion virginianus TaxID=2961670 RepID=UPI001EE7643D|nr:cuticle protein 12.5-like [Neodiprion virginianus]